MSREPYLPERGDIAWAVLDPRVGHEQSGKRPVLILSPRLLTEQTGLAVICPITSQVKGLPFEVLLSGCKTSGAVLPIHLRSVDVRVRKAAFIEKAPSDVLEAVTDHAGSLIGFIP